MKDVSDLIVLAPELFLAGMSLLLLLAGLFVRERWWGIIHFGALAVLAVTLFAVGGVGENRNLGFGSMVVDDGFARFIKILVLSGAIGALLIARPFQLRQKMAQFEYPVLILLASLGMMLVVSSHDFLSLYVGLELQSLSLYVLAAFQRDNARASEAGLKYFVLGALSSGLLLFGISLIYALTGTTDFTALSIYFSLAQPSGIAYVALVFVLAALAFKVSAAPFHMWTPDVYEGAPTPVTAFLAAAPKVAALALLTRVLFQPLYGLLNDWQQIMSALAVASMLIGGFAAIMQSSVKRLLAYSTIAHVGYMLLGLAAGSVVGIQAILIYLAIYFLNTLGVFAVVLALRRDGVPLDKLSDFAGLSRQRPMLACVMAIFMFSLAGVPPLAGFYGKFYVFMAAWQAGLIPLVFIGLLTSAVAAFYYLRIIKLMYFDAPVAAHDPLPETSLRLMLGAAAGYVLLLGLYPSPLIAMAGRAAAALLPKIP